MGDPNASIPTPQPVHYRPMFGAFGKALHARRRWCSCRRRRCEAGLRNKLGVEKEFVAVENTRGGISKKSMIHNGATPEDHGRSGDLRGDAPTANCSPASRPRCCRWRSGIFCSDDATLQFTRAPSRPAADAFSEDDGVVLAAIAGQRAILQLLGAERMHRLHHALEAGAGCRSSACACLPGSRLMRNARRNVHARALSGCEQLLADLELAATARSRSSV